MKRTIENIMLAPEARVVIQAVALEQAKTAADAAWEVLQGVDGLPNGLLDALETVSMTEVLL
jgi:hypothetical protein